MDRSKEIYEFVAKHPGCRRVDITREFDLHRGEIESVLSSMDKHGYLLWEDEWKQLYAFRRVEPNFRFR